MYNDLEKELGAQGWLGAVWLSEHLGLSPRQIANYRREDGTPAPKLVIDKMKSMIEKGEKYVSGK